MHSFRSSLALAGLLTLVTPALSAVIRENVVDQRQSEKGFEAIPDWLKGEVLSKVDITAESLEKRQQPGAECYEDVFLSVVQDVPAATPFCSSFIALPAATEYDTTTAYSTTKVFSTKTLPGTTTVTTSIVETVTAAPLLKRTHTTSAAPTVNPDLQPIFVASVSSACSCIDIPIATSTSVVTTTQATTRMGLRYVQHTVTTTEYTTVTAAVTSSALRVATSTPSSEPYQCPAQNGETVLKGGFAYTIQCGVDYPGNDITSAPATCLRECEELCSAHNNAEGVETQCEAVVFRISQQRCYLKPYPTGAPRHNPDANAALIGFRRASSTASSLASVSVGASVDVSATFETTTSSATLSTTASSTPTSDPLIMATADTCPGWNGTELVHIDAVTGARYTFITLCGTQAVMAGDIAASANSELNCQAACINANQGMSTMACQGITYSDSEGCVLHTSNEYWSQPRDGYNSFWLHTVSYGSEEDQPALVSEDRTPASALESAAAVEEPAITTITAVPQPVQARAAVLATDPEVVAYSSSSYSVSWSRSITQIERHTTVIVLISDSTTIISDEGYEAGGGGFGYELTAPAHVSATSTTSISSTGANRSGDFSTSSATSTSTAMSSMLYPSNSSTTTSTISFTSGNRSGDFSSTTTTTVTSTTFSTILPPQYTFPSLTSTSSMPFATNSSTTASQVSSTGENRSGDFSTTTSVPTSGTSSPLFTSNSSSSSSQMMTTSSSTTTDSSTSISSTGANRSGTFSTTTSIPSNSTVSFPTISFSTTLSPLSNSTSTSASSTSIPSSNSTTSSMSMPSNSTTAGPVTTSSISSTSGLRSGDFSTTTPAPYTSNSSSVISSPTAPPTSSLSLNISSTSGLRTGGFSTTTSPPYTSNSSSVMSLPTAPPTSSLSFNISSTSGLRTGGFSTTSMFSSNSSISMASSTASISSNASTCAPFTTTVFVTPSAMTVTVTENPSDMSSESSSHSNAMTTHIPTETVTLTPSSSQAFRTFDPLETTTTAETTTSAHAIPPSYGYKQKKRAMKRSVLNA